MSRNKLIDPERMVGFGENPGGFTAQTVNGTTHSPSPAKGGWNNQGNTSERDDKMLAARARRDRLDGGMLDFTTPHARGSV